jgi:hypothetical protein
MGSGSDESIYWFLTIVTTLSYHSYKIVINITHNQLTVSKYKNALSEVSHSTTDWTISDWDWTNYKHSESPLCRLSTDSTENILARLHSVS